MNDLTIQEQLWEAETYIERQKEAIKRYEKALKKIAESKDDPWFSCSTVAKDALGFYEKEVE